MPDKKIDPIAARDHGLREATAAYAQTEKVIVGGESPVSLIVLSRERARRKAITCKPAKARDLVGRIDPLIETVRDRRACSDPRGQSLKASTAEPA
ncbi:MAG: hypothetical protein M9939_04565 [Mesorhizobium sp.]|mgnify:CR=1 FL=1|nr:hypothetical protein [Mesorhizobium sp.]MCO5160383.1 hypothetical protein [Mesorhizobium sp.]